MRQAFVRGKEWWDCHARCLAQSQIGPIELEKGLANVMRILYTLFCKAKER
jgi:hypothetical protein